MTCRGGGRGSRRRLGRIAGGQLGQRHVFIDVSVFIMLLLFRLTPCAGTGVRLWVLWLDQRSMQGKKKKKRIEEKRREK